MKGVPYADCTDKTSWISDASRLGSNDLKESLVAGDAVRPLASLLDQIFSRFPYSLGRAYPLLGELNQFSATSGKQAPPLLSTERPLQLLVPSGDQFLGIRELLQMSEIILQSLYETGSEIFSQDILEARILEQLCVLLDRMQTVVVSTHIVGERFAPRPIATTVVCKEELPARLERSMEVSQKSGLAVDMEKSVARVGGIVSGIRT